MAPKLGFDPGLVNEAIGVLSAFAGASWLFERETPQVRGPLLQGGHPLRHALAVAGQIQIAEVLELCHYLKEVPRAADVVAGLRDNYDHTFLQLAFAYRFKCAGVTHLDLEPTVGTGRGDISFLLGGVPFVVECWAPGSRRRRGGPEEELQLVCTQLTELCGKLEGEGDSLCLSIAVELLETLSVSLRLRVVQAVRAHVAKPAFRTDLLEVEGARIFVAVTLPIPAGESGPLFTNGLGVSGMPDLASALSRAPREEVFSLTKPHASGDHRSRVGIWTTKAVPASGLERASADELTRIAARLGRKMRQTKAAPDTRRIAVVRTWTVDSGSVEQEDVQGLRNRVCNHENCDGILLVGRRWMEDAKRHSFRMVCADGDAESVLLRRVRDAEAELFLPPLTVRIPLDEDENDL